MIYAQMENNICVGISDVAGEIINDNYAEIDNFDISLLGRAMTKEMDGLVGYTDVTPDYDSYLQELSGNITFNHDDKTFVMEVVNKNPNVIKKGLIDAIQSYLDTEAQAHFYDGILSLCSYATSVSPKFGQEGRAGVVWRDACWTEGYKILAECEAETRPIPTPDELLAEMPSMDWPS